MLLLTFALGCAPLRVDGAPVPDFARSAALGRDLFTRTWVPDDPRAGGDGLGPIANATSCAACHNQGGVGGAGPRERNAPVLGAADGVRRNPPALFGLGRLDAVPDEALLQVVLAPSPVGTPPGRPGRDAAGRVTRFGWKAQVARLDTFVGQACALELGLQTSSFPQRPVLGRAEGPGDDLSDRDVGALVAFVRLLPAPAVQADTPGRGEGERLFEAVGCADCHRRSVGGVDGAYTDLLLHDMGGKLTQPTGHGYGSRGTDTRAVAGGAKPNEWRTPPLWGVRDSAPYLHDGRAATLDEAIRAHDGDASASRRAYVALALPQQGRVTAFLDSLVAP